MDPYKLGHMRRKTFQTRLESTDSTVRLRVSIPEGGDRNGVLPREYQHRGHAWPCRYRSIHWRPDTALATECFTLSAEPCVANKSLWSRPPAATMFYIERLQQKCLYFSFSYRF